MKQQTLFRAIVVIAVVLLFAVGLSLAQEGDAPAADLSAPDAAAGTAFTYQGQLEDGDGPVNDSCDFEFALYDDATAGGQVGSSPLAKTATVSDGLFSVALDFGAGAFDGDARWLEIAACCPSTCTPTTLDPRQELTPAPYALYAPTSNVKQLIQDFVVASGESVTAGDVVQFVDGYVLQDPGYGVEYVFEEVGAAYISAAVLSPTKFVVVWTDSTTYSGAAVIGDVTGNTIIYGLEYPFDSFGYNPSVAALSSTKFVVAYVADDGTDYLGRTKIGDVSGTEITYGSPYPFSSSVSDWQSASALSSTKFVVAYQDSDNLGKAVIGVVTDDTTINFGTEYVFNSALTRYTSAAALSDAKFVVAYEDGGNSDYGTAVIGDVDDKIIGFGSPSVFNEDITPYTSAAALSSTKFVVAYNDSGNIGYGTAVIGDVDGTGIIYGSEFVFNETNTIAISAAAFSSTKFVVVYNAIDIPHGAAVIGDVSNTTISYVPEVVFNPADSRYISAAALSSRKFVMAYADYGNSDYGTAVIGGVPSNTVGIARESKTEGQTVPVIIGGVSDVHSGLTPGEIYYSDAGDLTTSVTDQRIGLAISDTELLLDFDIY